MINVNQIKWEELQDAYGEASKVCDFLKQVLNNKIPAHDPQSGPWFELWSRLYHQGSIYTASYAIVPILVDSIKEESRPFAMDFFLLPVSIELARVEGDAPEVPDAIKGSYANSISELGLVATKTLNRGVSDSYLKKAAQAA